MICSNCHCPISNNRFTLTLLDKYYPICDYCALTIPNEDIGIIPLLQKSGNEFAPFKLLTINSIIQHWSNLATTLQIPIINPDDIKIVTIEELKELGNQLRTFAKENVIVNYNETNYWTEWQKKGFAVPYGMNGFIFTLFLSYHEQDGWIFSISSPNLRNLPDDFCKQIADIILPDVKCKIKRLFPVVFFEQDTSQDISQDISP
jgi:hypothetical protein